MLQISGKRQFNVQSKSYGGTALRLMKFKAPEPKAYRLTRTSRNQKRITCTKNKRLAKRLSGYGFIGIAIGIEIDFLDPIAGRTSFME